MFKTIWYICFHKMNHVNAVLKNDNLIVATATRFRYYKKNKTCCKQQNKMRLYMKKAVTLFVVVAMSFLATLDSSIVNIALPAISESLKVPLSSIEWVVASYIMIICSTLLFFGKLGDSIGKSKVFRGGTLLFITGTLLCGTSRSFIQLVICRFIQGIGASAYMANNQGIITQMYQHEGRGKALGILAAAVALGTMTGSPLGGFIVSVWKWNDIFYVNVPFGMAVFLLGLRYLPDDENNSKPEKQHTDIQGFIQQFAGTTLLFTALIGAQKQGFSSPYILVSIILAIVFLIFFVRREKKISYPLLDLSLFTNRVYTVSLLCAFISYICIAAYTLLLPFYFENTLKQTASFSGLLMMAAPVVITCLSPFCGTLADRIGSEKLTAAGLLLMAGSFFCMSSFTLYTSASLCAAYLGIMAVGQSFFQPANNSLIMSACPKNKLGTGGSVNSLVRNMGQYTGIVLCTTLLYDFMGRKAGYPVCDYIKGRDDIFVYGMKYDCLILMIVCIAGALLTFYRIRHLHRQVTL